MNTSITYQEHGTHGLSGRTRNKKVTSDKRGTVTSDKLKVTSSGVRNQESGVSGKEERGKRKEQRKKRK